MTTEKKAFNLTIGGRENAWPFVALIILGALLFGDNEHEHDLTDALICAVHTYGECK